MPLFSQETKPLLQKINSPYYASGRKSAKNIRLVLRRADDMAPPTSRGLNTALQHSGKFLLLSDIVALISAFIFGGMSAWTADTLWFKTGFQLVLHTETITEVIIFMGMGALAILWLDTRGHYRHRLPFWESLGNILAVACIGFLVCGFVAFASQKNFSRLWLGFSWAIFPLMLFAGRATVRSFLMKQGKWEIPSILIGTGPSAEAAMHALSREPHMGLKIVEQIAPATLPQLSRPHTWNRLLRASNARHILLALEGKDIEENGAALKTLVRERLPFSIIPPWLGLPAGTLSPHHFLFHDVLMLHDTNRLTLPLPRFLKRSFDIVVSGIALICLSPLFLWVSLMVRRDGGPAFFKQPRVGKSSKIFACYKFRSMRLGAEAYLDRFLAENEEAALEWRKFQKLKNDVRITPFGHFIRRTSIDELPQLINVFKGEMSLIGPRPIMKGQEEFYGDDFMYYESVRPGITGPWQVCGRNRLTFSERVMLESSYARNWSLWMDIVILLKTIPAVLKNDHAF